jgi:transcription antitermination factor NusG
MVLEAGILSSTLLPEVGAGECSEVVLNPSFEFSGGRLRPANSESDGRRFDAGDRVSSQSIGFGLNAAINPGLAIAATEAERKWFAVFAVPQNEKAVVRHLDLRNIESFLPTYETVKVWKNRQKVKIVLPLFPTYLFVHIECGERGKVLQCPGVIRIVGSHKERTSIPDTEIEFLRVGFNGKKLEPYTDLVVGERVRVRSGPMQGLQGTLVRRGNGMRFVLSIETINRSASVELDADCLEPIRA